MKLLSVFTPLARFGRKVGEFNSRVLLSVVYIIGLGSAAVLAKIFRKHFLDLKVEPEKESYWTDRKEKITLEDFKRSF